MAHSSFHPSMRLRVPTVLHRAARYLVLFLTGLRCRLLPAGGPHLRRSSLTRQGIRKLKSRPTMRGFTCKTTGACGRTLRSATDCALRHRMRLAITEIGLLELGLRVALVAGMRRRKLWSAGGWGVAMVDVQ